MDLTESEAKNIIRSLLISSKIRISIGQLNKDFRKAVGYGIPYSKFGFKSLQEYLNSLKDTLRICGNDKHAEVQVIVTEESAHVYKLVSKQKRQSKFKTRSNFWSKTDGKFNSPRLFHGRSGFGKRFKAPQLSSSSAPYNSKCDEPQYKSVANTANADVQKSTTKPINDALHKHTPVRSSKPETSNKQSFESSHGTVPDISYEPTLPHNTSSYFYSQKTDTDQYSRLLLNASKVCDFRNVDDNFDSRPFSTRSGFKNHNAPHIFSSVAPFSTRGVFEDHNAPQISSSVAPYQSKCNGPHYVSVCNAAYEDAQRNTTEPINDASHRQTPVISPEPGTSGKQSFESSHVTMPDLSLRPTNHNASSYFHSEKTDVDRRKKRRDNKSKIKQTKSKARNIQASNRELQKVQLTASSPSESDEADLFYCDRDEEVNGGIPQIIRSNLRELLAKYPAGIWGARMQDLYRKEFGTNLEYSKYGYRSLSQMCEDLGYAFHCIQIGQGDFKVLYTKKSIPADLLNIVRRLEYLKMNDVAEDSTEPALPEDCVHELLINAHESNIAQDIVKFGEFISSQWLESNEKVGDYIDINVTEVYDPSKFWINLRPRVKKLDKLMDGMQQFYGANAKTYEVPQFEMKTGLYISVVLLAEYHRGVIVDTMDHEESLIKVFFIDYGTVSLVSSSGVCYLHEQFGSLPAQSIRARLGGIYPPVENEQWSREATNRFFTFVKNRDLLAQITKIDVKRDALELIIVDTSGEDDFYINDDLVYAECAAFTYQEQYTAEPKPFVPIVKFIHLFPTFDELENGLVPTATQMISFGLSGVGIERIYPQYFKDAERDVKSLVSVFNNWSTKFDCDLAETECVATQSEDDKIRGATEVKEESDGKKCCTENTKVHFGKPENLWLRNDDVAASAVNDKGYIDRWLDGITTFPPDNQEKSTKKVRNSSRKWSTKFDCDLAETECVATQSEDDEIRGESEVKEESDGKKCRTENTKVHFGKPENLWLRNDDVAASTVHDKGSIERWLRGITTFPPDNQKKSTKKVRNSLKKLDPREEFVPKRRNRDLEIKENGANKPAEKDFVHRLFYAEDTSTNERPLTPQDPEYTQFTLNANSSATHSNAEFLKTEKKLEVKPVKHKIVYENWSRSESNSCSASFVPTVGKLEIPSTSHDSTCETASAYPDVHVAKKRLKPPHDIKPAPVPDGQSMTLAATQNNYIAQTLNIRPVAQSQILLSTLQPPVFVGGLYMPVPYSNAELTMQNAIPNPLPQ